MLPSFIDFSKMKLKRALYSAGLVRHAHGGRHGLVGKTDLAEMKRAFQIAFLQSQGLLPEHKLLDLGCGTLRGGIPIIQYLLPGNYYGLGVREIVLTEAKKELQEHGLEQKVPVLLLSSVAARVLENIKFDYIWAFSVFIHMHDTVLRENMSFVAYHLAEDGVFFGNVKIGPAEERTWQGFPVMTRPLTFYEREAERCHLTLRVLGSLESLGHISHQATQDQQIMLQCRHR